MSMVCGQPMQTSWARRSEDLTFDKTDEKDAVLIARLTAQLRCYAPEPVDQTWGRLRHLGARREEPVVANVAQVQQVRDLLDCVWPAALTTAAQPFRSTTWAAAMNVVLVRDDGNLERTRRLGWPRFERAVRREITRQGGQKPCLRIARNLYTNTADQVGCSPTDAVPWNGSPGCWPTGRQTSSVWPRPRTGWSRSSTSSSSLRW
jgi:hypothetical protein